MSQGFIVQKLFLRRTSVLGRWGPGPGNLGREGAKGVLLEGMGLARKVICEEISLPIGQILVKIQQTYAYHFPV